MINTISLKDKIFISGSRGLAGSAIVRSLKRAGYGEKREGGLLLIPNREELNLLNEKEVKDWFNHNSPQIVIHAAGKVGGILANSSQPADFILENIKIQTNVIEAAFLSGAKRLVFLGSSCIYPKFSKQPINEEALLTGALESTNEWYAIAKIAGLKLCHSLRLQYGFDAITLMPTNLYGPNDNYNNKSSHVMASLIRKFIEAKSKNEEVVTCWGSGSSMREFMHVDDLGDAVVFALEKWHPDSKNAPVDTNGLPLNHLNVGTGKDISIKNLATIIANEANYRGNIIWDRSKPDGTPKKQLNTKRFNSIGWSPKIDLITGIKMTIMNYNNQLSR
tara:strand:+ start:935 stop:1936 length:1002 start_codon:yes stop_codon:yes gene_type:complete